MVLQEPHIILYLFLPYVIINKNGKRILITSILDPLFSNYFRQDKLTLTDPVVVLK